MQTAERILTIKITRTLPGNQQENRMLMIAANATYSELESKVRKTLKLDDGHAVNLHYIDDEHDRVTLASDEELTCALSLTDGKPLQLYVVTKIGGMPHGDSKPKSDGDSTPADSASLCDQAVQKLVEKLEGMDIHLPEKRCRKILSRWNGNVDLAAEAIQLKRERRHHFVAKMAHHHRCGRPHPSSGFRFHRPPHTGHWQAPTEMGPSCLPPPPHTWARQHQHQQPIPKDFEALLDVLEGKGFGGNAHKRWRNVRLLHRFGGDVGQTEAFLLHRRAQREEFRQAIKGHARHPRGHGWHPRCPPPGFGYPPFAKSGHHSGRRWRCHYECGH